MEVFELVSYIWIMACDSVGSLSITQNNRKILLSNPHLFAPPASGETMIAFLHSGIFSRIHLRTAGSAYRLSTGMSKNPWICEAWRSIVMIWSAPATESMLATSLAEMGARDCQDKRCISVLILDFSNKYSKSQNSKEHIAKQLGETFFLA